RRSPRRHRRPRSGREAYSTGTRAPVAACHTIGECHTGAERGDAPDRGDILAGSRFLSTGESHGPALSLLAADLPTGGSEDPTDDLLDGLGRASPRETTAGVAAGDLATSLLLAARVEVRSHVLRIGRTAASAEPPSWQALDTVEASPVRCVDEKASAAMVAEI